jgi:hypothetical protein
MKMKSVLEGDVRPSSSILDGGGKLPRKFSHPDLNALADAASAEQYQRFHADADLPTKVDGAVDIVDLVSFHEINNIQRALDSATKAIGFQTSCLAKREPFTFTVMQLLDQLGAVNNLMIDIIKANQQEQRHPRRIPGSDLTRSAAVICLNTAIDAACGDLTFLVSPPKDPKTTHSKATASISILFGGRPFRATL